MKKFWKGIIFVMGLLTFLSGLFGCKNRKPDIANPPEGYEGGLQGNEGLGDEAVENESGLSGFHYAYYGSIGGDSYSYEVRYGDPDSDEYLEEGEEPGEPEDPEKLYLVYENMLYGEYGVMKTEVSPDVLQKLGTIYHERKLYRWEGFDMTDTDCLDGDGFSLSLKFADGKRMSATGSNAYPKGYRDFKMEMDEFFKPLADGMLEKERQKIVDAGFSGNVDFYMMNFKEQGTSGSDSYKFFICQPGVRENNVDVEIDSVSGSFLPIGEYRLYGAADVSLLKFKELQELVEKYNLIEWYNYEEAAEDYNNCEWFQIDIGTDEDFYLRACGTEHPANYEDFREEFLQLMTGMVEELQKLPAFSEE